MKRLDVILPLLLALLLSACHKIEEWDDNPRGNFEALWTIMDEHYCFFAEKGCGLERGTRPLLCEDKR